MTFESCGVVTGGLVRDEKELYTIYVKPEHESLLVTNASKRLHERVVSSGKNHEMI